MEMINISHMVFMDKTTIQRFQVRMSLPPLYVLPTNGSVCKNPSASPIDELPKFATFFSTSLGNLTRSKRTKDMTMVTTVRKKMARGNIATVLA